MRLLILCSLIAVAAVIVWLIIKKNGTNDTAAGLSGYLAKLEGFKAAKDFFGADGCSGIAVDDAAQKLCLVVNHGQFSSRVISYREILAVEIVENGYQVMKATKRSGFEGLAPLENFAEQPTVGVEPGQALDLPADLSDSGQPTPFQAMAGQPQELIAAKAEKVNKIELNLIIDNLQEPIHTVVFFAAETERGSAEYNIALASAKIWYSRLCILLQQADNEAESALSDTNGVAAQLVADEVNKLADLQARGLISEEEFQAQKAKIMQPREV